MGTQHAAQPPNGPIREKTRKHAVTWVDLVNRYPSVRSQAQKAAPCAVPSVWNVQSRQMRRERNGGARGGFPEPREEEMGRVLMRRGAFGVMSGFCSSW